jgi:hypothetical protein
MTDEIVFRPAQRCCPGRIQTQKGAFKVGNDKHILRNAPDSRAFTRLRLNSVFQNVVETTQRYFGFDAFGIATMWPV